MKATQVGPTVIERKDDVLYIEQTYVAEQPMDKIWVEIKLK